MAEEGQEEKVKSGFIIERDDIRGETSIKCGFNDNHESQRIAFDRTEQSRELCEKLSR